MSTHLRRSGGSTGACAAAVLSVWLVACAGAWEVSNVSGGGSGAEASARRVAGHVAASSRLTPACAELAARLAEASIRARTAQLRPTADMFEQRHAAAAARWTQGRCPDRALPGIAFGSSQAASLALDGRERGSVFRWPG